MLKFIKNKISDAYTNYKYNKVIKLSDNYNLKDNLSNNQLTNQLINQGYIVWDNFLTDDNCDKLENIKQFGNSVKKIDNKVINNNSTAFKIISNKIINNLIQSYLGQSACLDYIEYQRTEFNSCNKSISEKWHYDNVGKRIKIFYFFNDCDQVFTDYLQGTNLIYHKKYSTSDSRINDKFLNKFKDSNVSILPKKNRLVIFDTNGYHRGVYRNNNNNNDKASEQIRDMILLEYSCEKKSNILKSDILGPRRTFFSPEINFDDTLVNRKYLVDFKGFYFYDKSFVDSF